MTIYKNAGFKIGDKVRVVKKVEHENGWGNKWLHGMDKLIGATFTIGSIDEYGIGFKGLHYGFPPSSLELVTEEPQSVNQKRHKHADVIHAWAEGAEIEYRHGPNHWWHDAINPCWDNDFQYRIKHKEPEWWENIPEHGILVKDKNSGQISAPTTVHHVYGYNFNGDTSGKYWEPLTNEEIERFKR